MLGVVGLVDGTHIRIQRPTEIEADYINRHFYHSINVQVISHRIERSVMYWDVSLGLYVENTFSMGENILGDSGFMLKPYLLTPYRQPTSTPSLTTIMHIKHKSYY